MTTYATDIVAVFSGIDLSDDVHTHVGVGASLGAVPMEYEPVYDPKTNTWRQVDVHQGWATTAIPVVAEFDTTGELTAWVIALKAACRAGGTLTWQWTTDEAVRTYVIGASDEPEIVEDNDYLLRHRVEFMLALTRWPSAGPLVIVEPEIVDVPEGSEGVHYSTTAWGGYGTCSYDVRPPATPPSYGDLIVIGDDVYRGRVVNVPEMLITTAAQDEAGIVVVSGTYHVVCEGASRELGRDEAFAMAFRDRDLSKWQVSDCGEAWSAIGDGFQINASLEGSVRLTGAAPEELMSYTSPAATTHYTTHVGNFPPAVSPSSDYPNPAGVPVWSAAWYLLQDGLTEDRISMLKCDVEWSTLTPLQDALTVPDLDNPIGWPDPDPDIANRFATYDDLNMWTGFYGASPGCFFGGIYACNDDDPIPLPVYDPLAMYTDSRCVHRFSVRTSGSIDGLELGVDANLLCVYTSYRPIQKPVWASEVYDETEQHLMRTGWCALNRYYAEPGCFVELTNVVVLANGFAADCNDLAEVFPLMIEGSTCVSSPVAPESSIMVRPFTTKLAAIEDLLALTDQPRVWGCYEEDEGGDPLLVIAEDFGSVTFDPALPGVSVSAQLAVDGAVETCSVVYQPHESQGAVSDRLGAAFMPHLLMVGGTVAAERNAFRDASGTAHSVDAATMEGEDEIAKRGYGMWDGQIVLEDVPGGLAVRAGTKVTCGAATDVLVTGTSVDLDSKTVTLTLGSYGYKPRFRFFSAKRTGGAGRGEMPGYAARLDTRRRT